MPSKEICIYIIIKEDIIVSSILCRVKYATGRAISFVIFIKIKSLMNFSHIQQECGGVYIIYVCIYIRLRL